MKKISIGTKISLVFVTVLFIGLIIISIVKFILPASKVADITPKITTKVTAIQPSKANDLKNTKFLIEEKMKKLKQEIIKFSFNKEIKKVEQKVTKFPFKEKIEESEQKVTAITKK